MKVEIILTVEKTKSKDEEVKKREEEKKLLEKIKKYGAFNEKGEWQIEN